ncbi:MAG: DNA repair protein RecN [Candidatus Protistobacter heckmanni]|nr:DNA repair protein RecN [Candidatus Protistobacter heckmanni]
MLRSLTIRDFVIVASLDLEFDAGFTVLSGETGAGKSILIDALALSLGGRADGGVVREGAGRADLSAEFDLPGNDPELKDWLAENAFDAEDGVLMLRRVVDSGGRSKGFINGSPATLAQLREAGDRLVDIHGQHAHQLLLKPGAQRCLLDAHAGLAPQAAEMAKLWKALAALDAQIADAGKHERELALEREQLEWQLAELDKLAPQEGEWEQVHAEHSRLANAASLIEGTSGALEVLTQADGAALPQIETIEAKLGELAGYDPQLGETAELLNAAAVQVQEAAHALARYAQRLDLDPEKLAEAEARMQALHGAARKYRVAPEGLAALHAEKRERLASLERAQNLEALQAEREAAHAAYLKTAKALSKARAAAAKKLAGEVTQSMQTLAMAGGSFDIALTPAEGGAHGLEQIEFLVAGHAGVTPRPLAKVASGGELARISLALSVITSRASPTPTLIFDEVDSGIGGAVAEVVGRLLRTLGAERQVLCVTHLPQVAALGHHHFQVSKQSKVGKTESRIAPVLGEERTEEIARMLGGASITATTRKHAAEMLGAV